MDNYDTITKHMLLHVQSFSWCLLIWQVTENAGLVRMNSASTMFPLILGLSFVKRIPSGGTSGKTGKESVPLIVKVAMFYCLLTTLMGDQYCNNVMKKIL